MSETTDIVDPSVALLARRLRATVVTSGPEDIARLDPSIPVVAC